ncbi:serine/threonine-protein kinase DCLK3 [Boleophthalmus pectinirostris]|uniref:serine/threonine-protein kinase DCLK3 n=1 Tax=Boleophthalmus pectinirostris TaxID=150288 RepID=UPI00242BCCD6|nr:serine/threonine-protein kinase DCLK3 [Boleophthalmus pectinirostris]
MPQPWPLHPQKAHHLPPQLPLFHTRHAEESAERPHLVTIIRPGDQSTMRKVTVLLNRRGVVSFEQLLLDLSEALGFPRWHRNRVTRLYTVHAREVKGVCDFFCGEVAFLALGKARPDLSSVQEALEELFPDNTHYQAGALTSWEKRLRPSPDKAAKADSGYSEGTDSSGTQTNQEEQKHTNTQIKNPKNISRQQKNSKNTRKLPVPNNLQKLRVKIGQMQRPSSVIGPFKHQDLIRDLDVPSPTLCGNCLARQARCQPQEQSNVLSGKAPLPPVMKKPTGRVPSPEERTKFDAQPAALSASLNDDEVFVQSHHHIMSPAIIEPHRPMESFASPLRESNVTLSDIEQCYEIGRVVGDGNFAVVRECRHRDSGQTLALKIIDRSKLIGREHMMQNELSLLGSLRHPRIVRLFAHHHTDTHSYLVMEFVCGGDLFEAISEKGKFSEVEAGMMVSDISQALSYIHCKSIVHRDLKPENLLIERQSDCIYRLKLGDFGLAMVVTEPVFTICGTPTYVAPEILLETGYGVPVDIWALGVLLYILLCGFPPFRSHERDQEELFQLIKQAHLHFLSPYWDPISEEAKHLVRMLLQPDPLLRLTAEQTLMHPWVKAMTSICQQGVLTEEKHRAPKAEEQSERLPKPAAATLSDNKLISIEGVPIYNAELSIERQSKMDANRRQSIKTPSPAKIQQEQLKRTGESMQK